MLRAPLTVYCLSALCCVGCRPAQVAVVVLPNDFQGEAYLLYSSKVSEQHDDQYEQDASNAVILVREDGWAVIHSEGSRECRAVYHPRDVVRLTRGHLELAQDVGGQFYGYFGGCTEIDSGVVMHGTFSDTLPLVVGKDLSNADFDAKVRGLIRDRGGWP